MKSDRVVSLVIMSLSSSVKSTLIAADANTTSAKFDQSISKKFDLYEFIHSRLPNKLYQLRLMVLETHSRWNQPRKRERQCGFKHLA